MSSLNYFELFRWTLPEAVLVLTALVVLLADALGLRDTSLRQRSLAAALISMVGSGAAIVLVLLQTGEFSWMQGMFTSDRLSRIGQVSLLVLGLFTFLISSESQFTCHPAEYFCLQLLALTGFLFLVSSDNLLVIFTSLELASLCLYVLAAFAKADLRSVEAGLKYFLFGSMAAAFTLFGISLLYGITGHLDLPGIASALAAESPGPLLLVAIVMLLVGFGFKTAFVPFHLWAPETYQGAPIPSAALIAAGSKLASFLVLAKVLLIGFPNGPVLGMQPGWVPLIALVAAASMLVGNLAALAQRSVRRLLAFSAIAHGGYVLLGIIAQNGLGLGALLYYLIVYGLTIIGAFAVVAFVERTTGSDQIEAFAGLREQSPIVAFCLAIFLLSLAGIPPLAGFFGKFYIFTAALNTGTGRFEWLGLVLLALLTSAISLYYYLLVLKQVYVRPAEGTTATERVHSSELIAIICLAALVIILGCFPEWLLKQLVAAAPFLEFP